MNFYVLRNREANPRNEDLSRFKAVASLFTHIEAIAFVGKRAKFGMAIVDLEPRLACYRNCIWDSLIPFELFPFTPILGEKVWKRLAVF